MEKIAPLITFQIKEGAKTKDGKEYHICDAFDDIEDAFNEGVKYRYHETRISKNDGAIVFICTDIVCWQLFKRLWTLKREKKIKTFSVFPFGDLLNGKDAKKLDDSLIEELFNKLIEKSGEVLIKELSRKSFEELIEKSGEESKKLYEKLNTEIGRLKIEN